MQKCLFCNKISPEFYLCKQCRKKLISSQEQNSLYVYNDFAKKIIHRIKYNDDYELAKIFKLKFLIYKIKYFNYIWINVPNSAMQLQKRNVNVNETILYKALVKSSTPCIRIDHVVMSKSKNRKAECLKFQTIKSIKKNKKIIIFDDIVTTGTTINSFKKFIDLEFKPKKIKVVILFNNKQK